MILYIDTTKNVTVGFLNSKDFSWSYYSLLDSNKSSVILHDEIYKGLLSLDQEVSDIETCISIAGPGSYTGMRVSSGISQIFEWQSVESLSFLHFEVPKLCGFKEGIWFEKAFKKEYFVYKWSGDKSEKKLIAEDKLETELSLYSDHFSIESNGAKVKSTVSLIEKMPSSIFPYIISNKLKSDVFYYRTLEKEFGKK